MVFSPIFPWIRLNIYVLLNQIHFVGTISIFNWMNGKNCNWKSKMVLLNGGQEYFPLLDKNLFLLQKEKKYWVKILSGIVQFFDQILSFIAFTYVLLSIPSKLIHFKRRRRRKKQIKMLNNVKYQLNIQNGSFFRFVFCVSMNKVQFT